jgi:hypothetical protein
MNVGLCQLPHLGLLLLFDHVLLLVLAIVELKHLPLKLLVFLFGVDMLPLLKVDLGVELLLVQLLAQSGFLEVLSCLSRGYLILPLHNSSPFIIDL